MLNLFKTNPGLLITAILPLAAAALCMLIGVFMRQQGMSVRSLWWFMGFMLLVTGPQFAFHLSNALQLARAAKPREAALQTLAKPRGDVPADVRKAAAKALFGPDADADLVQDAKPIFAESLADAEHAQFAVLPGGETALVAFFDDVGDAQNAWVASLRMMGVTETAKGDSSRGCSATRAVGDRVYALPQGRMLTVWTGKDDATIVRRMQSGSFVLPRRAPLEAPAESASQKQGFGGAILAAAMACYLLVVVAYFFKGAAWASSVPARTGVQAASIDELRSRLLAINDLDVPFSVQQGHDGDELVITWRYADAKWIDLARVRGIRRTHKLELTLDREDSVVRVQEFASSSDWSAGAGGADMHWKAALGITFFQYEHQRVFGLQLDADGRPQPSLTYEYTFNLQEMKQPAIDVIASAGWTWRPVIWRGPKSLRWLTE